MTINSSSLWCGLDCRALVRSPGLPWFAVQCGVLWLALLAATMGAAAAPVSVLAGVLLILAVSWAVSRVHASGALSARTAAVGYGVLVVTWAVLVQSNQVSDFGVYYRCGGEFIPRPWSFHGWAAACESQWLPGYAFYWRRSVLYGLPIGMLGLSLLGWKLLNAGLHLAAVCLLYRYLVAPAGRAAAMMASCLLALFPEFWFSTTLASPDNVVPLGLIGLAVLLRRASQERSPRWVVAGIVVIVAGLDLVRSIGPLLLVGLVFVALASPDRAVRVRIVAVALASAVVVLALGALPGWLGIAARQNTSLVANVVGSGATQRHGFSHAYAWHQYVVPLLESMQRESALMTGFLAEDLQHAGRLAAHWAAKTVALSGGEGYYFFSASQALGSTDDVLVAGAPTLPFVGTVAQALRGMVLGALLLAAIGCVRAPASAWMRAPLGITVAIALYVVVVGEVQARYSLLLAPGLCACAAGCMSREVRTRTSVAISAGGTLAAASAAALLVVGALVWSTWRLQAVPALLLQQPSGTCMTSSSSLRLASEGGCATIRAVVDGLHGDLSFVVTRDPVVPRWDNAARPGVTLVSTIRVANNPPLVAEHHIGARDTSVVIDLPVVPGAHVELTLSNGGGSSAVEVGYFHHAKDIVRVRLGS